MLVTRGKLKKLNLNQEGEAHELDSFIFVSDDYLTNDDKLLILIHGSGVVRAGQWARRSVVTKLAIFPFLK